MNTLLNTNHRLPKKIEFNYPGNKIEKQMSSLSSYLFALAFSFPTVLSILSIVKIRNLEEFIAEQENSSARLDQLDKKIDLVTDELDEKLDLFHDDIVNSLKDFIEQAE